MGNILAPRANVQFQKEVFFKGTICAKQIDIRDRCIILHHSSITGPSASPLAKFGYSDDLQTDDSGNLSALPMEFALEQNYPNPFNPTTTIQFALPEAGNVILAIYNVSGQKVRTLVSGGLEAGIHNLQWNATNDFGEKVGSGIYLYRISAGGKHHATRKMILLK